MMSELQETDAKWFFENYKVLSLKYGKCYLAIKNKSVIGVYDDSISGVHKTLETEKIGTFIVQECTGTEERLPYLELAVHSFMTNI